MGGRVAEELVFGEDKLSTGCSSDLQKATEIATTLARQLSMSADSRLGLAVDKDSLSEFSNFKIDSEIEILLRESLVRTRDKLSQHRPALEKLAHRLMKEETLTADQVQSCMPWFY